MIYLPDTNAFSRYLRGRDALLRDRLRAVLPDLRLSVIVAAELEYGARKRPDLPHLAQRLDLLFSTIPVLDFDRPDAAFYGIIRAHLANLKPNAQLIGQNDAMIAAQAMRLGAVVITHNTSEFSRVPGLSVEDWQS